ncbi:relA-associated inhibitor [Megalops cyprinoides]|uniref:relA-associated inhibitor n=1 Tax=Megalops cyprinoides TaxID=118141 RepID=UPI001864051E|nr:relA-associated inhibitor [Megalops cyprinoides]
MNPQTSYSSSMMFQSINEDLTASLAVADELSREFSSLMQECTPSVAEPRPQTVSSGASAQMTPNSSLPDSSDKGGESSISQSLPYMPVSQVSEPSPRPVDSVVTSSKYNPSSPLFSPRQFTPPQTRKNRLSSSYRSGSESSYGQLTPPNQSPQAQRRMSPAHLTPYDSSRISGYVERSPSPNPSYDQSSRFTLQPAPYSSGSMGRRSPRMDRSPSPRSFSQPASSTLPRNFMPFRPPDEGLQRQKSPAQWNETDLDVAYERKPHHTYDKTEWLRPSVPNSNWRESNLDAPPPTSRKDSHARPHHPSYTSLPRNARLAVLPDGSSSPHSSSPYSPQPIISRISIPPSTPQARQHRPIPLSVIMRLQNPYGYQASAHYPRGQGGDSNSAMYRQPLLLPREYLPQPAPPEQRQPAVYGEVLNPEDVDAELERLDPIREQVASEGGDEQQGGDPAAIPRPLSPTRLQPVVAPEIKEVPDRQELLRLRAEIPRALKRRGSVDQSQPLTKVPLIPPNQYKQIISKLFRRKGIRYKGEQGSETSSSSDGEESPTPPSPASPPHSPAQVTPEQKGLPSILRRPGRERKSSGRHAKLSPLVLLLDGALVGELDTVQRAVQEMSDPSQPNDEGITALHNAICGGHYAVVDFLVRIGANVSAPDSHGWTPLHCAASCNDQVLCEYLVRNGAAVMAVTESDGATASQKCDPFAVGYEECESFLRGVEEAMGVENSGVLYALWGYPAQAPDELSFKEGDMVTILQKPEGMDWWWASLCGREGFVPNNYFGLFPKVRPKSLC